MLQGVRACALRCHCRLCHRVLFPGVVPILEVYGAHHSQPKLTLQHAGVICRFLASTYHLDGSSDEQRRVCDMVLAT